MTGADLLRPLRAAWRPVLAARFALFQRHRYDRLVLEEVAGLPFLVLPQVFNPALLRTGALLAERLAAGAVRRGARVLDVGTGSGALAVVAAAAGARVVAVDINPHAVRCAGMNALLNRVESRVDVREGDLFGPVSCERFDLVVSNPPYHRGEPRSPLDAAWRSPDFPERFAAGLPEHLTPGGSALVVLSTDGVPEAFLAAFAAAGLPVAVDARFDLINEVVTVYRVGGRP